MKRKDRIFNDGIFFYDVQMALWLEWVGSELEIVDEKELEQIWINGVPRDDFRAA